METEYISFEDYLKREKHLSRLKKQGVKLLYSKSRFKAVCGVGCLIVAIIPNGLGVVFYPLGFYLLGFNKIDLKQKSENLLRISKNKLRGCLI